ncbi:MAG: serine hydrolase [Candidatus Rokubacteria bacterium]|nr:serine hydrolase [Candidatus Rokubacteria bacterium]
MRVRALFLTALLLAAAPAFAAPDEELLGKAEGYPLCPASLRPQPRCLIGLVSRFDEIFPARTVTRASAPRPLKRAEPEPAIRYTYLGRTHTLDDYLARHRTTGLLVLKHDTILVERYQYERTPQHRMASYSMAKTVVAMLVGIARAEGRIASLDDHAERYVPELKGMPYGATSLRHLLMMASGVRFLETYVASDDVALLARLSILQGSDGGAATVLPFRTRDHAPGTRFSYASAETQVLGLVLRAATGKPLAEYLAETLWQPMGAEADASWLIDKGGYEAAYMGLNATLRDWGRLGLLLAHDGARDGRAIIPAPWVRAATTPAGKAFEPGFTGSAFGYGYQTWILPAPTRQFFLRGLRGQAVFVDPGSKTVLVHTAARDVGDAGLWELIALWSAVTRGGPGFTPGP